MAKRRRASVQEALEAATAGVPVTPQTQVDEKAEESEAAAEAVGSTADKAEEKQPAKRRAAPRKRATSKVGQRKKRTKAAAKEKKGHKKTSTGYLKTTGQEIVRLTLHLTPDQKRNLKIQSLQAGFENTSAYIVDELDL